MKQKAKNWVNQMQAGILTRAEILTSLQTTILHTLTYPLLCKQWTRKECEYITSILLFYALPAMGICRQFPRRL